MERTRRSHTAVYLLLACVALLCLPGSAAPAFASAAVATAAASSTMAAGAGLPSDGHLHSSSVRLPRRDSRRPVAVLPRRTAAGARAVTRRQGMLPAGLVPALRRALQHEQQAAYTSRPQRGAYRAANSEQRLPISFTSTGPRLSPTSGAARRSWGLLPAAYSSAEHPRPVPAAQPVQAATRLEYRRGALTESYMDDLRGLGQGSTLWTPPAQLAGRGMALALRPSAGLAARPAGGQFMVVTAPMVGTALRYGGTVVADALGRRLPARLTLAVSQARARADDRGTVSHVRLTTLPQQAELLAPNGAAGDNFGASVAISGETALVGAPGGPSKAGAAYVFVRGSGTTWSLQQKLTPADSAVGDAFGASVALSGTTALIGAPGTNGDANTIGAAYVFTRSGTTWTQQATLTPTGSAPGSSFGASVALSGNTALIGAPGAYAAYVFTRGGTTWTQEATLTPTGGAAGSNFGASVALSGNTALIGAPASNGAFTAPAAYVFVGSGATWTQQALLTEPPEGDPPDGAGSAVALDGDTALVGAPLEDCNGEWEEFVRSGTTWTATFDQCGLAAGFGSAMALVGDTAVVGADHGGNNTGAAYIFARSGTTWSQQQTLVAADAFAGDLFAAAVGFDGSNVVVGAPGKGGNTGAAYIFSNSSTPNCQTNVWEGLPYLNRYDTFVDNGSGVCVKQSYAIHDSTFTTLSITTGTNYLEANVTVGILTIGAGVAVQATAGGLYVTGTLNAPGTAAAPVTLTAPGTPPTVGGWRGVAFRPGSTGTLSHVHLFGAGAQGLLDSTGGSHQAGILVEGASLAIDSSLIDYSAGNGIEVLGGANPTLTGDDFTGNAAWAVLYDAGNLPNTFDQDSGLSATGDGHDAVGFPGGTVNGSWTTGTPLGLPVALTGDVTVTSLTLAAGGNLLMAANLYVSGSLSMNGTAAAPIVLTSAAATPGAGDWGGIAFQPGSSGTLSYVHLSYAGATGLHDSGGGSHQAGILVEGASPTIGNTTVDFSAGAGIEVMSGANPTLSDDQFANLSGAYGVQIDDIASLPTLSGDSFANCAVRVSPDGVDRLSALDYDGSGLAIDVLGGTMAASDTWPALGMPYRVLADLTVPGGATLTLPAPATVRFSGGGLYVAGTLNAQGTAANPIALTTASSPAAPGGWRGLAFRPGSSGTLSYVHLSNAGATGLHDSGGGSHQTGILVEGAGPTIGNAIVDFSAGVGIEVLGGGAPTISNDQFANLIGAYGVQVDDIASLPTLSGDTCTGCAVRVSPDGVDRLSALNYGGSGLAVDVLGGTMAASDTWPALGLPYRVLGDLTVPAAATLTLPAPATVRFSGGGLYVAGTLSAQGTSANPIALTTASSPPAPGGWRGLAFRPGSGGTLSYVHLSYAGATGLHDSGGGSHQTGILVEGATPTIGNSTIDQGSGSGAEVVASSGMPTLTNDAFTNNGGRAVQLDFLPVGVTSFTGLTATGNGDNAIGISGGTYAGTGTWAGAGIPYHPAQSLTIQGQLTLGAGLSMRVCHGCSITFNSASAALNASGTATSPVTLTSDAATPAPGDWIGLCLGGSGSGASLSYVFLSYAGAGYCGSGSGIYVYQGAGTITIANATIDHSANYGIELAGGATLTNDAFTNNVGRAVQFDFLPTSTAGVTGLSASGNGDDAVGLSGGTYAGTGTWAGAGIPYHLAQSLTIQGQLTLGAGVTMRICHGCSFTFNGASAALNAGGTAAAPVTLTSDAATPAPGDWIGLCLGGYGSAASLSYLRVSYAGAGYCGSGSGVYVYQGAGTITIANATIDHSANYGLELAGGATLTNDAFTNNTGRAVQYDFVPTDLSQLSGLSASGNGDDEIGIAGGGFGINGGGQTGTGTWPNLGLPYHLDTGLGIYGNLTLGAGVTIRVCHGCGISVYSASAALNAAGTAASPVTLTSDAATPAPGDWIGLCLGGSGTGASLSYLHLSYAGAAYCGGGAGIYVYQGAGAITIANATIDHSANYGLELAGGATLTNDTVTNNAGRPLQYDFIPTDLSQITGLSATGNGDNEIGIVGGGYPCCGAGYSGTGTWPNLGLPYHLNSSLGVFGNLTLGAGVTMRVCHGCVIDVGNNPGAVFTVSGTAAAPVTLTSDAATPAPGDWLGLWLGGSAGPANVSYLHLSAAGSCYGGICAAIYVYQGSSAVTLTNSIIDQSAGNDLELNGSPVTAHENSFGAVPSGFYGVINDSGSTVDASCNWWDDQTGPAGAGLGAGAPVSQAVSYQPWLTSVAPAPAADCNGANTTLQVHAGWNIVSLAVTPFSPMQSGHFLSALLSATGGGLAAIYGLTNNAWRPSQILNGTTLSGSPFAVQPGQGYLLYSDHGGSYTFSGIMAAAPLPWTLAAGWNLVGIAQTGQPPLQAADVLTTLLQRTGGGLAAIYGLTNGAWRPSLIDNQQNGQGLIGQPFTLQPGQGYLLYTDRAVSGFTPSAARLRSGLRIAVRRLSGPALAHLHLGLPRLPALPTRTLP